MNPVRMRRLLREDRRLRFAVIFGSVARGAAKPDSDLDLALASSQSLDLFDRKSLWLAAQLTREAGREVQLVSLFESPLALRFAVAREGSLLWARDRREFDRFRAHVFVEHADMEPIASRVRRAFFDRVVRESRG